MLNGVQTRISQKIPIITQQMETDFRETNTLEI